MSRAIFAAAIVATAAGLASAGTINGQYNGSYTGWVINTTAGNFGVGALSHTWSGGAGTLSRFNGTYGTFCIDNKVVSTSSMPFTLQRVTNAPVTTDGNFGNPGQTYTAMQEKRLAAVVKVVQTLGYMDYRGGFVPSAFANNDDRRDWSAAIQLAVWESLWEDTAGAGWDITSATNSVTNAFRIAGTSQSALPNVVAHFNTIAGLATTAFNSNMVQTGVRALSGSAINSNGSERGQDQLVIIPLPPAAWAGLASLAGVIGFGYIRRRQLRA